MRRAGATWTVDWAGTPAEPLVGHIVRRVAAGNTVTGYYRVTAVRQVRTRKPLPEPYVARHRVHAEFVGQDVRQAGGADWTFYANRRAPRTLDRDRFSPLL